MERSLNYYVLLLVLGHFLCSGNLLFSCFGLCSSSFPLFIWLIEFYSAMDIYWFQILFLNAHSMFLILLLFVELLPFVFSLCFCHIILCFSLLVIDSLDHQDMFLNSVTAECISCTWVWHLNCFVLFSFFFSPFCCCSNRYTCWTSWVQWSFPNLFVPPPCSLCCTIVYQLSTLFYPY